jgi:cysteine desulfurase
MTTFTKPIYLDYAATTPIDKRVAAVMANYLTQDGEFGNPSSQHSYGVNAKLAVENARAQIAALLGAEPSELIFTSGATEADNLAIKGAAQLYQRKGRHIVTLKTEHKAVLDACQYLEKQGYRVTYLTPDADGRLNMDQFRASLMPDTTLVSIMHVNNETGVIQDLAAIAAETSARGILLHVDAAQSAGKIPLNVTTLPIDLMSLAAHKIYGPKGVGVLYLRKKPRVRIEPLFHGGGHEQGMRSGTLAVHQIVGMGAACEIAKREREDDYANITKLNQYLLSLLQPITNLFINAHHALRSPYILNLRFENMLADAILKQIPEIAVSTASACQGIGTEGSYVLRALGLTELQAKSSLRISFGRFTTQQEIEMAAHAINRVFNNR